MSEKTTQPERLPVIEGTIELGDQVQDKITGITGIAIGITDWIYGCKRIVVQPQEVHEGKPAETFSADEPQMAIVKKAVIEGREEPTHGVRDDRKSMSRKSTPVRKSVTKR